MFVRDQQRQQTKTGREEFETRSIDMFIGKFSLECARSNTHLSVPDVGFSVK